MNQESKNRALVLSGGSVRGVAYIGALQACDYLGYDFDMVGGVSAGSILSSLIAAGYDWKELTDIALDLQKSKDTDLIDYNWSQLLLTPWQYLFSKKEKGFTGLVKWEKLQKFIADLLLKKWVSNFEDVQHPLFLSAVCIQDAQEKLFSNIQKEESLWYSVSRAVRASISIPVTFEPVEIDGKYYVDGGVRVNFPVLKAQRLWATHVLGINLGYDGKMKENIVKKGVFAILNQSFDIMIKDQFDADRELFQLRDQNDTLILHQMKIYSEGTFDMDSIETMISQGFKQTVEFIQNNSVFLEPFKMREEEKNNPDLRKLVKKVY